MDDILEYLSFVVILTTTLKNYYEPPNGVMKVKSRCVKI